MANLKKCDKCGRIGPPYSFTNISARFDTGLKRNSGSYNYNDYAEKSADMCKACAGEALDAFEAFLGEAFLFNGPMEPSRQTGSARESLAKMKDPEG